MKIQCYLDSSIKLSDSERAILLLKNIEIVEFNPVHSNLENIEYLLLHSRLADETLKQMKQCKYIGIRAHNLDYVNTTLVVEMGIPVKGLERQYGANGVAEHTFALIFSF